ncbi:MAG: hypothetical protein PVG53_03355 [Holophagae bacterium]
MIGGIDPPESMLSRARAEARPRHRRRRSDRRSVLLIAGLAVALILGTAGDGVAARWYDDYQRAVELIDGGDCSREAIQLLGAAVVDKPKPRRNARTIAVKTVDYFPYYQLARAHLSCGEVDAARDYIAESRRRGVAPESQLAALEARLADVGGAEPSRGGEPVDTEALAGLAADAQATIRQAISASERLKSQRQTPWLADFFAANQSRLDQATSDLGAAQSEFSQGTLNRDRAAIESAGRTASRALDTLNQLEQEIGRIAPPQPTAAPTERRAPARPSATPVPSPLPTRPVVVSTQRSPTGSASPGAPGRGRRPPPVPDSLRQAASEYLTAGYDTVVQDLTPDDYPATEQRAAAYLLRAAAHFAIYCLDGRSDGDRLEQVERDIAQSTRLAPTLRPDPRFFSPEFIALFP